MSVSSSAITSGKWVSVGDNDFNAIIQYCSLLATPDRNTVFSVKAVGMYKAKQTQLVSSPSPDTKTRR